MMAKHHETKPEAEQLLTALAYRSDGSLLCKGKVKDDHTVYFDADPKDIQRSRVFILPEPGEGKNLASLNLQQLERRLAFEPRIRLNDDGGLIVGQIPDRIRDIWLWKRCCIRGRITNQASIEGQQETYPVCKATVHICEVDRIRWWVQQIDPKLLERLRHDLIERLPVPTPIPIPPRPLPAPPSFQPDFGEIPFRGAADVQLLRRPRQAVDLVQPVQLEYLHQQIAQADAGQFRSILADQFPVFFPYFCYFPYLWPWLYRCDEVAVVETDQNGRFEACIWHQEDQPDVYVWVEYPIDEGMETVYRPQISCGTYWDYDCGEDINIQLSDSRIPPVCGDVLEGTSVAVRSIGTLVSPLDIEQGLFNGIALPGQDYFRTVGLTRFATRNLEGYSDKLTNQFVRPFTGNIPIYAQFGDGLPNSDIHYFRVLYRRTHNAGLQTLISPYNLSFGWKTLNSGLLNRRYTIQTGLDFKYEYYKLGPFPVNGQDTYRIPPLDPQLPGIDGEPASPDPTARWSRYDRVTIGRIPTDQLDGNGLYEFRIQFLDQNGNLADVNSDFFRVSDSPDSNTTMEAPGAYLRQISGDAVFQFRMRIDNQAPAFRIAGVTLDGDDSVMTDCGFLEYSHNAQQVGISFEATHPQGFGLFEFNLERGRRDSVRNHFLLGDARGVVTGGKPPYTLGTDGMYEATFPVSTLLLGCGNRAAFSEVLTVAGLHTDGTHAGHFFRRSVSNAFALAPA